MAGEFLNTAPLQVGQGTLSQLNITAATLVKSGPGRVARVSVVVAGSAAGAVHDKASTGSLAAATQIAAIPNTVGVYTLDWPVNDGLVVAPGTGQTLSVSYS